MEKNYCGESRTILKVLGFLVKKYQMSYKFQSFDEYLGFSGPINTYSFYNEKGCFTLCQVVQRGEWGWYVSKEIHANLSGLLETEINQRDYIHHSSFSYKRTLKVLGDVIREQLEHSQHFFGIEVSKKIT